jgi:hypothetical protein
VEVFLGHPIPSFELRDMAATREHEERCVGIVPQKEPYFSSPDHRVGHQKAKVGINSRPRSDKDVLTTQHHLFRVQAVL